MSQSKIQSLESLTEQAALARSQGKRVVLAHGVFDLLHMGHIRYLQQARALGDVLFVTLTADAFVNKGPDRPVFNHNLRAESLAALAVVDGVAINHAPTAMNILALVKPDVYAKGVEYRDAANDVTGNIVREQQAVEAHGGKLAFIEDITFSSSQLLNSYFDVFPTDVQAFLVGFKQRQDTATLLSRMAQQLAGLRVLVIGDAIIDEYVTVDPLGVSGKGNTLTVAYKDKEQFAGGSIAVANHIAGFCSQVTLLTGLGGQRSHEAFIRQRLSPKVSPVFYYEQNGETLTKTRYVSDDLTRYFEIYNQAAFSLSDKVLAQFSQWIGEHAAEFDCVVVPDFGNGLISVDVARLLSEKSRFLAVNTQINSGNRGHHVISRYPKADFISLNEPELRLACHDRQSDLEGLAQRIGQQLGASAVAVTRGKKGAAVALPVMHEWLSVPALSKAVVDRIGAGDAFLSLASICLAAGMNAEEALFVGSVAAALDVQIVCNREPVSPAALHKTITTLLK
jgi:rfaE bifunctional protein kinase chain/domain/rfaE bifunctional protein nucleotidyltransferase chain/domain